MTHRVFQGTHPGLTLFCRQGFKLTKTTCSIASQFTNIQSDLSYFENVKNNPKPSMCLWNNNSFANVNFKTRHTQFSWNCINRSSTKKTTEFLHLDIRMICWLMRWMINSKHLSNLENFVWWFQVSYILAQHKKKSCEYLFKSCKSFIICNNVYVFLVTFLKDSLSNYRQ